MKTFALAASALALIGGALLNAPDAQAQTAARVESQTRPNFGLLLDPPTRQSRPRQQRRQGQGRRHLMPDIPGVVQVIRRFDPACQRLEALVQPAALARARRGPGGDRGGAHPGPLGRRRRVVHRQRGRAGAVAGPRQPRV